VSLFGRKISSSSLPIFDRFEKGFEVTGAETLHENTKRPTGIRILRINFSFNLGHISIRNKLIL
uniref:Uncharacterized protein n=1 Tax=Romanomermis culicivorax TaxID=13658 RepID=A0A915I4I2_ROMCU